LFNVNRATFAAGSEGMVERLVLFLNRNAGRMAIIEGHTDNTGSREYNQSLSRDRAFAVQEALVKAGISAHRLAVRGVGESDPVASNELESGRRLNRRVDVVLLE
jgi:outer membrane protein OmpA-like peptidoglycan-associated protein